MAVGILIAARDLNVSQKGDIAAIHDEPWSWGKNETLPRYVRVTIEDANAEQVKHFRDAWNLKFRYEVLESNRVRISVDPSVVSASKVAEDRIAADMQEWCQAELKVAPREFSATAMTIDVPKEKSLEVLKAEFDDAFVERVDPRRYHVSSTLVDSIASQGGHITVSRAQALTMIADKIEE